MRKEFEKGRWYFAIQTDIWALYPSIGIVFRKYDRYKFYISILFLCFYLNIHFLRRKVDE